MATSEDLVIYNMWRETWKPFTPLFSTYITRVTLSKQVQAALTGDILDRYEDSKFRKIDAFQSHTFHELYKQTLDSPEFTKLLESQTIPLKVLKSFWLPTAYVRTRQAAEPRIVLILGAVNGEDLQNNEKGLPFSKIVDCASISNFTKELPWFKAYFSDRLEDGDTGPYGQRFSVQLSHKEVVADQIMIGVHFKVCATFCNLLEPLTFYFHSIMTETTLKKRHARQHVWDYSEWLSIEYTALLTIFFLQQCRLIPLLMRYTDELLPANLTLSRIEQWTNGLQFFSLEYYRKKYETQQTSLYSTLPVGTLFALMLNFYTKTCPLDKVTIHFDKGTFSELMSSEQDVFQIDTIMFRKNDYTCIKKFPRKTLYTNVMRKMLEHIQSPTTSPVGLTHALGKIRLDLEDLEHRDEAKD